MRASKPYIETYAGLPPVEVGARIERDDGWWRAVRLNIRSVAGSGRYTSQIEWRPVDVDGHAYLCATPEERFA